MHPVLLQTPWLTLYTFGVLLAAAYLAALGWMVRDGRRAGLDPDTLMSLGVWAIVGALAGAKALLIVRSYGDYLARPAELWSRSTLGSAGDFYGGVIGGLISSPLFFFFPSPIPPWRAAGGFSPPLSLGSGVWQELAV